MSDAQSAPAEVRRGRKPTARPETALLGTDPKQVEALEKRGRIILDLARSPKVDAGTLEQVATAENRRLAALSKKAAAVQDIEAPRFSIVRITPEMAKALLAIAFQSGRPYRCVKSAVDAYQEEMAAGRWVLNGAPLIFGKGPDRPLLDGYQRLLACARSGAPFDTLLAQNLGEEVVHTLDQARRRTFVAVLEAEGVELAPQVVPAMSRLIRMEKGTLGKRTSDALLPWGTLERYWVANKDDLIRAAEWGVARKTPVIGEAVRIILSYVAHRSDKVDLLREMLDAVKHPDHYEDRHPGVKLYERLASSDEGRMPLVTTLALALMAWNDMVTGERRRFYRWQPIEEGKRGGDEFPAVVGYPGLIRPALEEGAVAVTLEHGLAANYSQVSITVETVTPDLAAKYLRRNFRNRKIQRSHVAMLARDIKAGAFHFNGQPICFSVEQDGTLINGQHRLQAIVEAGEPVEMLVVRGLSPEAFHTYDRNPKRAASFQGVSSDLDGVGDVDIVRGIATLYWRLDVHNGRRVRPSVHDLRQLVAEHPNLAEARHWGRKLRDVGRPSTMGYIAYKLLSEDAHLAEYFLEALATGADLPARSPILVLRRRLIEIRTDKVKHDRLEPIGLVEKAWETWIRRYAANPEEEQDEDPSAE
ncbi:hypothetical protein [Azospirillum soli]|uniref:hypothetical protein n=1 Tax=Azospirillum soli TaxID=1304799 RepID=UPI001AE0F5B8|nr:hypothetical protein [Azospirillum soli]MBP2315493.1 hypothetical protein [Azospirillum soli]